jgi:ribosomal protein L35AE/L33A
MTPQEARRNIGRCVAYRANDRSTPEYGQITGVSENGWVFVKYGTDMHSKATSASQLKLEVES